MNKRSVFQLLLTATVVVSGCKDETASSDGAAASEAALASITSDDLMRHTQVLAADSLEGRAPGTIGEERTVRYLTEQFKALGLQPGNPNGTYTQDVPLVGLSARPIASFTAGGQNIPLSFLKDFVAVSRRVTPEIKVDNSDIVFVGYGVVFAGLGMGEAS